MSSRATFFTLRRAIWRSIAIMVVLLALYVLVGRQLTPMIERTAPTLENYLSDMLEQPVQIDTLEGEWRGFGPSITVRGLQIGDSFALSTLVLEPALIESLTKQNMIFSRFSVNGADIRVEHDGDGWGVPAFAVVDQDQQLQEVFAELYNQLLAQDSIQVRNINLLLDGFDQQLELLLVDALILDTHEYHELAGEFMIDPAGQAVSANVQMEARNTRSEPDVSVYLRHDALNATNLLPDVVTGGGFRPSHLDLAAQWWLNWDSGELSTIQTQIQRGGVRFMTPESDQEQVLSDLSGAFLWEQPEDADNPERQGKIRDLSFIYNDQAWGRSDHDVWLNSDELTVTTDHLAIADLGRMIQPSLPLDLFERHAIRGRLSDVTVSVPREEDSGFQWLEARVTGQLNDGEFAPAGQIPGFQRVDGWFYATAREGVVEAAEGPMQVQIPGQLPEPIDMSLNPGGAVAWRLSDDLNLKIASNTVAFDWRDQGAVQGRFAFTGSMDPDADTLAEPVFALSLGGERLTTEGLFSALPINLQPQVLDWMHNRMSELEARDWVLAIPNLLADQLAPRIGQMGARVDTLTVDVGDDWLELTEMAADFWLDHTGIHYVLDAGRFSGLELVSGDLQLPFDAPGTTFLHMTGQASGLVSDGWKIVTETPVRDVLTGDLANWQMAGDLGGHVSLSIPLIENLGQPDAEAEVSVDLSLDMRDGLLYMPELDMLFTDIQGPIDFSTETGLRSDRVDARLFDRPLHTAISTQVSDTGDWLFQFPGEANVALNRLGAWLDDPWLSEQPYHIDVLGALEVTQGQVRLALESDLVGLPLDWPAPLGKAAEDWRPLELTLSFDDQEQILEALYDRALAVDLALNPGFEIIRGNISLGDDVVAVEDDSLGLDIRLANLALDEWVPHWTRMQALYGWDPVSDIQPEMEDASDLRRIADAIPFELINLSTERLTFGELGLDGLTLSMEQNVDGWLAEFDAAQLSGLLALPDDWEEPGLLTLDYVRVGDEDEEIVDTEFIPVEELDEQPPERRTREPYNYDAADDWLTALPLAYIPRLRVRLDELTVGGDEMGVWQFDVMPDTNAQQVNIDNINGEIRSVDVTGDLVWIMPDEGQHYTRANLSARANNLGTVLERSGLTPVITSESAEFNTDIGWPGTPLAFNSLGMSGRIDFDARNGSLRELDDFDAVRIIGLLNVTRIFRRLSLDFRDVFSAGFTYDQVAGDLLFDHGQASVGERLLLDGSGAKMFFGGDYDMLADELDAEGVVIARVSNTAGFIALGAGFSPPVALMVIFGERALERELERLFSVRTRITGSLAQPEVSASRLFDSDIRGNDATVEERMRELFGPEAR